MTEREMLVRAKRYSVTAMSVSNARRVSQLIRRHRHLLSQLMIDLTTNTRVHPSVHVQLSDEPAS